MGDGVSGGALHVPGRSHEMPDGGCVGVVYRFDAGTSEGRVMSTKAKRNPDDTTKLLNDLVEAGNLRREEVRHALRGGLLLKYRPPDAANVNCRLLAYRMESEPSLIERRIVRSALEVVLMTTLAKA